MLTKRLQFRMSFAMKEVCDTGFCTSHTCYDAVSSKTISAMPCIVHFVMNQSLFISFAVYGTPNSADDNLCLLLALLKTPRTAPEVD